MPVPRKKSDSEPIWRVNTVNERVNITSVPDRFPKKETEIHHAADHVEQVQAGEQVNKALGGIDAAKNARIDHFHPSACLQHHEYDAKQQGSTEEYPVVKEAFVGKGEVGFVECDAAEQNDQRAQPEHVRQGHQMRRFVVCTQQESDENGSKQQRTAGNAQPKHKAKRLTAFGEWVFGLSGCMLRTHLPFIDIFKKRNSR